MRAEISLSNPNFSVRRNGSAVTLIFDDDGDGEVSVDVTFNVAEASVLAHELSVAVEP